MKEQPKTSDTVNRGWIEKISLLLFWLLVGFAGLITGYGVYLMATDRDPSVKRDRASQNRVEKTSKRKFTVRKHRFRKEQFYKRYRFKGMKRNGNKIQGVRIYVEGEQSDPAILKEGDQLMKIDNEKIDHMNDGVRLQHMITKGKSTELKVIRNGESKRLVIRFEDSEHTTGMKKTSAAASEADHQSKK